MTNELMVPPHDQNAERSVLGALLLYRPGMHAEGKDPGITDLDLAKNRNGPSIHIPLYFNESQTVFRAVDRIHGKEGGR